MTMNGRKWLPLICGLIFGTIVTHFAHLSTTKTMFGTSLNTEKIAIKSSLTAETPVISSQLTSRTALTPTVEQNVHELDIPTELYKRVRILCLIFTHPSNYESKATAVNNTWARRCNQHAFVGSEPTHLKLPLMRLNVTEHHDNLWQKTWNSLDYAEKNFDLNQFDFVLKADDDTYVVMENLRLILLPLDPDKASFVGRRFRYNGETSRPYMSGGAGYVLSRRALQLFVQTAVRNPKADPCLRQLRHSEDFLLGSCLKRLGVEFIDSRDAKGLERFHPMSADYMIGWASMPMPDWMSKFNYFKFKACLRGCVSSQSATFHYVGPMDMYKLEFLFYEMSPVGVNPNRIEEREAIEILKKRKKNY